MALFCTKVKKKKKIHVHKVPLNCQSTDKMLLNFWESVEVGGEIGKIGIIGGARGYAYYRSRLSFDLTFFLLFVVIYVDRCQIYSSPDKADFLLQGISQRKTFKPRIGNCKGEEKDRLRLGYTAFVQHCLFLCALMCLLPPPYLSFSRETLCKTS